MQPYQFYVVLCAILKEKKSCDDTIIITYPNDSACIVLYKIMHVQMYATSRLNDIHNV